MPSSSSDYYGDLVCAAAFTMVTPIFAWLAATQEEAPLYLARIPVPVWSVSFCFLYTVLHWAAWQQNSRRISQCAFASSLWFCSFVNLQQWPYAGECVITIQFQGSVVGCLSNLSLPFEEQVLRFAMLFAVASYVSISSPFSVYTEDVLPHLGGTILLALGFLVVTKKLTIQKMDLLAVNAARWVLAAIYMYHTACDLLLITSTGDDEQGMLQVSAQEKLMAIVKAAFIACVGVVATGTFQSQIDHKELLEEQVQERSKELKMVEHALHASETAIAITDSACRIIWLNNACTKLCSITTDRRPQGQSILEVLSLETIENERKLKDAFCLTRSSTRQEEIEIDQQIFLLEVSPFPELEGESPSKKCCDDPQLSPTNRFLVVLKNITADRKRAFAEKVAREEQMVAKAMSDSMVTLTHELRTPMQGIMGVTSMLLSNSHLQSIHQGEALESLKLIMASSRLLLNLINNLLDVKRADAKMMGEFELTAIDPCGPIKDTVDFCQPLASISNVSIVTESDWGSRTPHDHSCQVMSNALRLQQILINLVSNALKYTLPETEIRIRIRRTVRSEVDSLLENSLASSQGACSNDGDNVRVSDDPVLLFSVSDGGPGVAPYQAGRLFRRFGRLDKPPTRAIGGGGKIGQPSGTGFGLHLCQLFVQRMKGEIWATNNNAGGETKGSKFSFFLPLATEEDLRATRNLNSAVMLGLPQIVPALPGKECNLKRNRSLDELGMAALDLKVLLVDDILINRKVLGRMIKNVGVSNVVVVDSGGSALSELLDANANEQPYHLVITDLQMPGMSGTELSEAIVAAAATGELHRPVVVGLTADTTPLVAEKCAASGMADIIYKPITVLEMKDYFESTVGYLQPGIWFSSTGRGRNRISTSRSSMPAPAAIETRSPGPAIEAHCKDPCSIRTQ